MKRGLTPFTDQRRQGLHYTVVRGVTAVVGSHGATPVRTLAMATPVS